MRLFNQIKNNEFKLNEVDLDSIKEAYPIYWNFIFNLLIGKNPDHYYRQNNTKIDLISQFLSGKFPKQIKPLYRGILLNPHEVINKKIKGIARITYVSFSEDKQIALAFADTKNDISRYAMQANPNQKGYLITKNSYASSELMFHYEWLFDTRLITNFKNAVGGDARFVEIQKEVVLKPESEYSVEEVVPGISNNLHVGNE